MSNNKNPNFYNAADVQPDTSIAPKITPLIFSKNIKDNYKTIPQNTTLNTLGQARHFPAATKEWFNSVYAYNKNFIKNLPTLDKTLDGILKSYFNMYLNDSLLKTLEEKKSKKGFKRVTNKRVVNRIKHLSLNKIFLGKAELKHTSSKVIITLFVFNAEKLSLNRKIMSILTRIFPSLRILKNLNRAGNSKEEFNRPITFISRFAKILNLSWIILSILYKTKPKNTKYNIEKNSNYMHQSGLINTATRKKLAVELEQYKAFDGITINPDLFKAGIFKAATMIYLNKELKAFAETKMKLAINKAKFEDSFISKLTPVISKLYNKEVEFNIVNLKTLYLNSDILVQAIATKLKNRNNKLLKVLKFALSMVKLPKVNRIEEKYGRDDRGHMWMNRAKNLTLSSYCHSLTPMLSDKEDNNKKDSLSQLLIDILPVESQSNAVENLALSNIKHKVLRGARLEAKGRLTRRFTAARSVFKVKWTGGIKNIESSYKGLSTVLLRGHAKSNVQYSCINSKNRIGAYGIKGWIAGK